jgi:N-acetylmuramoyl-L-alanine amidase
MNIIDVGLQFSNHLTPRQSTTRIVMHHSDADPNLTVQQIHAEHLAKGWAGIGYHYYIPGDGLIYRGRPEIMIGAHAYQDPQHEANSNGIGICLGGNFMQVLPTQAQMAAAVWLIENIWTRYHGIPVIGHRDVMATACPGDMFPMQDLLSELKGANNMPDGATACTILVGAKIYPGYILGGHVFFGQGVPVAEFINIINRVPEWHSESTQLIIK